MTNPNMAVDTQILDVLRRKQDDAIAAFANSLAAVPATLGNSVRDSHGAVCTASFAAVRDALAKRKTAVEKSRAESDRLANMLPIASARYTGTDSSAAGTLNKEMPSA